MREGRVEPHRRVEIRPAAGPSDIEAVRGLFREHARARKLEAIRLDTLPEVRAAQSLYRALGFAEIEPYYHNPIPGTRYFELALREADAVRRPAP